MRLEKLHYIIVLIYLAILHGPREPCNQEMPSYPTIYVADVGLSTCVKL